MLINPALPQISSNLIYHMILLNYFFSSPDIKPVRPNQNNDFRQWLKTKRLSVSEFSAWVKNKVFFKPYFPWIEDVYVARIIDLVFCMICPDEIFRLYNMSICFVLGLGQIQCCCWGFFVYKRQISESQRKGNYKKIRKLICSDVKRWLLHL